MGNIPSMMAAGMSGEEAKSVVGDIALGLTAAGTTAADALQLSADVNEVTTAATDSGVKLPSRDTGSTVIVANGGANALDVYPPTGEQINNQTADAPAIVAANHGVLLIKISATKWAAVLD